MSEQATSKRSRGGREHAGSEPAEPRSDARKAAGDAQAHGAEARQSAEMRAAKSAKAGFDKKIVALVYDFDGTLSPRPMQEYAFLPKIGAEAKEFWAESNRIAKEHGADILITYMHLLYKKAKEKGIRIDRDDLVAQGKSVEYFAGVEDWFEAISDYVNIRSEIVEGTSIYDRVHNVFASEYWFEAYDMPYPKRVISDTGKTQYLFRINKGIEDLGRNINEHMDEGERPIPFSNMIYFGDGDTDVPSMAVMRKNGGHAVAVYPPGKSKAKCVDLFKAGRCDFFAPADYRRGSDLFKRTCLLIDRILADMRVQEEVWRLGRGLR
jgi:hypothetical protein